MNRKDIINVLERLNPFLEVSGGSVVQQAIYKSQAQRLREQADKIELQDAAIWKFRELLSNLKQEQYEEDVLGQVGKELLNENK